jgi:hypothetical protein
MSDRLKSQRILRIRGEILAAMKMLYPGAIQAEQLLRSLLAVYPLLEWEHLRKDLAYLLEKGYVKRVLRENEDLLLGPWRKRCFRLTAAGVEVADECVRDPAVGG